MRGLKILVIWVLSCGCVLAQEEGAFRKISIEPALTLNGFIDVGVSNAVYYNLNPRWQLVSLSSFSTEAIPLYKNVNGAGGIKTDHSLYFGQKFGIGGRLFGRKVGNSFYLLGGGQYKTIKGSYESPDDEIITASGSLWSPEFGLLYRVNRVQPQRRSFAFKVYVPLYPHTLGDNILKISLEFGLNVRLRAK